jgi:TolB-like protein
MSLIAELKRRNVFRVGVAYVICAWVIAQVADLVLDNIEAPDWVMQAIMLILAIGLPLVLIFAWAFELTPEGIKREKEVDPSESITHLTGRKLDFAIIGLLAIALIFVVVDNYVLEAEQIPTAEAVGREKSIAVLPFANMSGDPEQEFFSDGISEELLNVLAKVKGLRVTSRTSAFAFKDKDISIPEIAEKLGVKHVLEGSVRRAGNRVRITTQLIEVETDSHLWSESYDRELSDIFAVQDEIAAKVADALKVALLGAESQQIRPAREIPIEVYSDYLLARQKLADSTVAALGEAERLLKNVIEREPSYAPAYVGLATTYDFMAQTGMFSSSEASTRMMPLLEQAISLDDGLAEAWVNLAYARLSKNGDPRGVREARERALELDPQNPVVLRDQLFGWVWSHEPERALVYADELIRIDPLSLDNLGSVAWLYWRLGRLSDMEMMLERMRSLDPQSQSYLWRAWNLAYSRGDLVASLKFSETAMGIDIEDPEGPSGVAMTFFDLGDVAAAEYWNDAASRLDPEAPLVRMMAALFHLYHGEEAEAVAIARELARSGSYKRMTRGVALRIAVASDLAAGNSEEIIAHYIKEYPVLAEGKLPIGELSSVYDIGEAFSVTLDLAAAYLHAGEKAKAESLLSLVETELPHWPQIGVWGAGYGYADVELHALRGDKERALAALREDAAKGIRYLWRFHLLHNPNLESIRDTPEFAAIVAGIEADMAAQLARVREMERNGELEPIPEVSATTQ